jgi:multiple sugar transport system ATP-binding protein
VLLGVRPEDLHDRLYTQSAAEESSIKAIVEVVEPLGSEIQCHLSTGRQTIVARFKPDSQIAVGDEIDLAVNMEKIHLFDPENETRIE